LLGRGCWLSFGLLLRLLRFLVRQNDSDVTGSFQNPRTASACASIHSFESWAFADDRFLHDQAVGLQVRVVFCVRDCALERLINQERGLLWRESENIQRRRNRQTLHLSRDFARLERRNPRIPLYRS